MKPRLPLLLICLTTMLAPSHLVGQPTDGNGWRAARWGMTEGAVADAVGASLVRLPGRRIYGGAYATLAQKDILLGGKRFRAIFQMNLATGRLQQVLLEPVRRPRQEAQFRAALAELRETYGRPSGSCATPRDGNSPYSVEFWWQAPKTTVHLVFFDFYTRSIFFEDPNRDRDLWVPYVKIRRNNPRFLPRRTLVRFHPTARTDLMSARCRSKAR